MQIRTGVRAVAVYSFLAMSSALAQRFDAASIKPSSDDKTLAATPRTWGDSSDRVTLRHIPLKYVLMHVYDLQPTQISGPGWLDTDFFDILAVVPPGTPKEQVPRMFESLLAERFRLKFHLETHTERVYALVVAKGGPKLKEAVPYDPDAYKEAIHMSGSAENRTISGASSGPFGPFKMTVANGVLHSEFAGMSTKDLAKYLSQGQMDLPVIDMTGLTGVYQVSLDIGVRPGGAPAATLGEAPDPDPTAGSLLESLQKLGLNLVKRNETMEKFVVDSVDRVPTEN